VSARTDRRGFGSLDGLVAVAALALLFALVHPLIRRHARDRLIAAAIAQVESVREAATGYRAKEGHWPGNVEDGAVPEELTPFLAPDAPAPGDGYILAWTRWETVRVPPQPPPPPPDPHLPPRDLGTMPPPRPPSPAVAEGDSLGTRPAVVGELAGITVRSEASDLLAALLDRYGTATSFVRDSTWTLILTGTPATGPRAAPPAASAPGVTPHAW
jgi:hypothetical protein